MTRRDAQISTRTRARGYRSRPQHSVNCHDGVQGGGRLFLDDQSLRHTLDCDGEARRRPVARRRVHDGDNQLGVSGGVAVTEHPVDLTLDNFEALEPSMVQRLLTSKR
jgi:hypothetical protein